MKKRIKLLSWLMALILTVGTIPVSAFATESSTSVPAAPLKEKSDTTDTYITDQDINETAVPLVPVEGKIDGCVSELVDRREENVKHFQMSDGSVEAVVYGYAVHRKNSAGVWKDIDNTLSTGNVKTADAYATEDLRVVFAKSFVANQPIFALNENGYVVSMKMVEDRLSTSTVTQPLTPVEQAPITSVTNGSTRGEQVHWDSLEEAKTINHNGKILYSNIKTNTDLEYVLVGNNIKENIILNGVGEKYTYRFELMLSGLEAVLNESGTISLRDKTTGGEKYVMPIPYMYDAKGAVSYDVSYTLTTSGEDTYLLSVVADSAWIEAEERAFPVTVDPSINQSVFADTFIHAAYPNTNHGAFTEIGISSEQIAYFKMAMPTSIPSQSTIQVAYFYLSYFYADSVTSGWIRANVYKANYDWSEATITWNSASQYANMGLNTDTLITTAYFNGAISAYQSSPRGVSVDITSAAQAWYNGETNYGVGLTYGTGTLPNVVISSTESGSATAPYFVVRYEEPRLANGVYKIKNYATGRYIDMTDGGIASGTVLQQWSGTSTDGNRNQLFKITFINTYQYYNYYTIRPMTNNGLEITVDGSGNVTATSAPTVDVWASTPWAQCMAISKSGSYYVIQGGDWSENKYLSVSGGDGATLYHTTSVSSNSGWEFEPYTGEAFDEISIGRMTSSLIVGSSFDYDLGVSSTTIGRNGPVIYEVVGTDNALTEKAGIDSSTGVLTAYEAGTVKLRAKYSGINWYWVWYIDIQFEDGVYYIQNKQSNHYLQPDNNGESFMEQHTFSEGAEKNWNLIWYGSSYFKIQNVDSNLYLTAPSDTNENSTIVQAEALSNDRQLWSLTQTSSGGVKIQAKSHENTSLVMAVQNVLVFDGENVKQMVYTDDDNYKDEWSFYKLGDELMLLGIMDTAEDHDHFSCFSDAITCFGKTNDLNIIHTGYISSSSCLAQMQNAKVFISRSHGGYNSTHTWLKLFDSGTASRLYSSQIYDFSSSTALVDFSNMDLMLFVGCTTAFGGTAGTNLITASVNAGADYALGFEEDIHCDGANTWTSYFCEYYADGLSIYDAAQNAADDTAADHFILESLNNLNTDSFSIAH